MNFSRLLNNPTVCKTYVAATLSYGVLRKGIQMKDATISHYDSKQREYIRVPVLICDKVLMTTLCGIASIYAWPLYMYNDLKHLEIAMKKTLQPEWYNDHENKYLIDYMFS